MEVRYKCQHNKITSIDSKIANHILENILKREGRVFYTSGNKRIRGMKITLKKILIVKESFVENWMTEKIEPEKEEADNH